MHALVPIVLALVLSVALGVLCWAEFSEVLPHDMANVTQWRALEAAVANRTHVSSRPARVGLLLALHTGHLYLCLPMLHLTKVAYGFWLGLGFGWLLCCGWELLLFYIYLLCMPRSPEPAFLACTRRSRAAGRLFHDNLMFAVSSFPLHVSASLVLSGDASLAEFFAANALVTAVLTLKNVACGVILAASPETATLGVLAVVLAASTLLPTFATLYVTTQGLFIASYMHPEAPSAKGCADGADEKLCAGPAPACV